MAGVIDARLSDLGLKLPKAAAPVASYVPFTVSGNLVFVSGQLAASDGAVKFTGQLGADLSVEKGQEAAKLCALNLISQLKVALGGDLDRLSQVVRLGGFVNCTVDFTDQPKVINGASDLMIDVFQEKGKHARAAVGCAALPLDSAVEIDAIFEFET
ncbi:MAG: RidA family protein [Rhodospirillales bacterium]|nr:RidA family protein [Rhodospirillales bacterium]